MKLDSLISKTLKKEEYKNNLSCEEYDKIWNNLDQTLFDFDNEKSKVTFLKRLINKTKNLNLTGFIEVALFIFILIGIPVLITHYNTKSENQVITSIDNIKHSNKKTTEEIYLNKLTDIKDTNKFLDKYGWHINPNSGYNFTLTIPKDFKNKPDELPIGLYWKYNNELSKAIGLDLSNFRGKTVRVNISELKENLGYTSHKNINSIIIEYKQKIIGAWLANGNNNPILLDNSFLCALNKQFFGDIVKVSWGEWLENNGLENNKNGYEYTLKKLTPEDTINRFFKSIDNKDYNTALSLMCKIEQSTYLFKNTDKTKLYTSSFENNVIFDHTTLAKVQDIKFNNATSTEDLNKFTNFPKELPYNKLFNRKLYKRSSYDATVYLKFKNQTVIKNGLHKITISLVKETPASPWKIDYILSHENNYNNF